ncbi:MAG: VOC family protein [Rhizobiales bacterium]|nr:VOC family protein [Hyphomicrobiales bacterium]
MAENIVHMALVVKNYDEAIAYYTQKLNLTLLEDKNMGFDKALNADKRWVRVAPNANSGFSLLLAQAKND